MRPQVDSEAAFFRQSGFSGINLYKGNQGFLTKNNKVISGTSPEVLLYAFSGCRFEP